MPHLIKRLCAATFTVVLSLSLAGCLASKKQLFDESAAVTPLVTGQYRVYERGTGIRFKPTDVVTITRNGQGYDFTDSKQHSHRVTFYPLGGSIFNPFRRKTYIAQGKTDGDDFAYVEIEPRSDTIMIRTADCAKQDKAKLTALGVKLNGTDCRLDDVSDVKTLFATLRFDRSTSKLVKK
jgi:hypothetical protein